MEPKVGQRRNPASSSHGGGGGGGERPLDSAEPQSRSGFTSPPPPPRSRSRSSRSRFPSPPPGAVASSTSSALLLEPQEEEYRNSYEAGNPRSFSHSVKQQCWEKAEKIRGRDPDRWRRDALGNIVFRKLVGCPGCLCHDYDHIMPYSKGGKSTLENCQVLQATVNRSKGNRTEVSKADLIQKSAYCRVSGRDMDLLELSAYANVRRGQDSGGCNIQ